MKIKLSMKRRVINSLLGVLCCFAFTACNQDMMLEDDALRTSMNARTVYMQDFIPDRNAAVGAEVTLTDKRDNQVYRCIKMADGRWWMGENLKYNVTGSVSYNNDAANLETYGRLYKWQEAAGAIPENWDMPSDDEWKALEMALGMTKEDADAITAWRNSGNVGTQLKANGSSGMGLLLSGYQHTNGTFFYLGTYGRYWTSTEASSANALDRDVYSTKAGVYRGSFGKAYRYAIRCVLQVKETTQYMQTFVPDPADAVGTEVMLTDKRDNIVYRCIKMADGRWWMGENLKYDIEGSFIYNNDTTNLQTYGRLYEWREAMDAAPENWRLPRDYEWKVLEMALGMTQEDADKKFEWRKSGNVGTQLRKGGSSGLNLLLGGYRPTNGIYEYYGLGSTGHYWSYTEDYEYRLRMLYRTIYDREAVRRASNEKDEVYSVRYILEEKEEPLYMQNFVPNPADSVGTEVMLTDKRDDAVYRCIKMADGRWWMGENLKYAAVFCTMSDDKVYLKTYGRLYGLEEAINVAPENWSVPSDDEWKALEMVLGMTQEDADEKGWRYSGDTGTQLKENGNSNMNLLLGGYTSGYNYVEFHQLGSYGYYWSSTEYNSSDAWFRVVNSSQAGVLRNFSGKEDCFSIRCVRNL